MAFDPDAYLSAPSKSGGFDPDAYLAGKPQRTQAEWEASPEYAKLKASLAKDKAKTAREAAEPDPFSPAGFWKDRKEVAGNMVKGASAMATDELNTATLGAYKPLRHAIGSRVAPEWTKNVEASDEEAMKTLHQMPGGDVIRGVGNAGAAGIGAPGGIAKGVMGAVGAARPILGAALAGGITGGLQSSVESAGRGESVGQNLKSTGLGAGVGAATGAAIGGVGRLVGGAPERQFNREVGSLKEGVQYKTRIQKFVPNEQDMRAALEPEAEIRGALRHDPVEAKDLVDKKVEEVANRALNPLYQRLQETGKDGVPMELVANQLKAARAGYNRTAEKPQIAVIDSILDDLQQIATQNGGKIPAQELRETATAFGRQGFTNLPMLGQIPLSKQVRQDVSGALREAIGDHIESLASSDPDPAAGKVLRQAFESGNREVSTWLKIRDIVGEKAQRTTGNATPMGDLVTHAAHALAHPKMTALKAVAGAAPELTDRALRAGVDSRVGQALAPVGRGLQQTAQATLPQKGANLLIWAAQEKKRREREAAARLTGGGFPPGGQ